MIRAFSRVAVFLVALFATGATALADSFTIPGTVAAQGVFSCGDMTVSGGGTIDSSGIGTAGPTNHGTVRSNGKITVSSSTVNGDAIPGPGKSVSISGSGSVSGSTTPATSSIGCTPITLSTLATSLAASNDNATIPLTGQNKSVLASASHTEFSMSGGDTLTLPAGTYYFTKFTISGGSTITLGGPVRILVTGNVSISGGSFVNSSAYSFRFWHSGATFSLSSSTFTGIVYAPSASLTISSSRLTGSVFANSVGISGGTSHVTRSIDDLVPSVSITSPANGAGVSDASQVVVRGTVADGQTDVTVAVNGQAATIAADGTWQVTLNLSGSASPATVTAVATDAAGNSASANITIVTAVPVISLTSPAPGSFVSTRIVNLSGAAGTATSVTVNGLAATLAGGNWSRNAFDLGADGSHTLTITGVNGAGPATISPVLTNDTTNPIVTAAISPVPNANGWNKSNATVTFTCSDATRGVATCPAQVVVSTETASQLVSGTATDNAGNHAAASVTVKLDKTAPSIAITSPASGATVTSSALTVSGTVSDALSGVAGVTCNGVPASISSGTFTCNVTLVSGDNSITTIATDAAGNTASATRTVTYNPDSQPPSVAITSPVSGTFTKVSSVTVTGTASDDVAVQSVTVNGTPATLTNGNWTATITLSSSDGAKPITATATDTSNKTNSASITITLDTTPPLVAITSPASGTSTTSSSISVSGTVSDALSGVASVSCNNVAAAVSNGTFTCVVSLVVGDNLITASAIDVAGNTAAATRSVTYTPDAQAPSIAITSPVNGTFTNVATVTVTGPASDDVAVASVKVNDTLAVFTNGNWTATITLTGGDGAKTITATATDTTNKTNSASVQITLDTTAPTLTIATPASGAIVASPSLTINGTVSDALTGIASVTCNGVPATITTGTFTCSVTLLEGSNTINVAATDNTGNTTTTPLPVTLDTRAPDLTFTAPAPNACLSALQFNVTGKAFDPHVTSVNVSLGSSSVPLVAATIAADGSWTAAIVVPAEGRYTIVAEGKDSVGHVVTATLPVAVDTTVPAVLVTESGSAFSGGIARRPLSIAFRVVDADSSAAITATLDGQPFVSGTTVIAEGDHVLRVSARDCAGNASDVRTINFTIDTVAPSIVSIAPADSGSAQPTITGKLDADDVVSVVISGTSYAATISGRTFTFAGVMLAEGPNQLTIVATDRAGNSSTKAFTLNVKSTTPVVDILESGQPIVSGALFNRAIAPVVRVTESAATIDAKLNGNPFTSGATISADGGYVLRATASDGAGHTSPEAVATFTIDTTAPVVTISAPVDGALVHLDHADVHGTVVGADVASFTVGGNTVTIASDGTFTATIPLDNGPNVITAVARDRAGNSGSASINVTSDAARAGIILTLPVDQLPTNRTTTTVIGQVLTPSLAASVTLNGTPIAIDSNGVFRRNDFALVEGDNAITATVTDKGGTANSVTIHVPLDSAPPRLRVLANGSDLTAGARFTTAPTITLDATDASGTVTATLTIDGVAVTQIPALTNGGHALVAIARDAAGNETRIDRTFSNGDATGSGGCPPASFDPADRSSIFADHVMLTGRAAASSVLIGSAVVPVVDGAFATSLQLNAEGANPVSITCADASGHALGTSSTLTLFRYTNAPSVTITAPATDSELTADKTQVAITAGAGVVSGDVNGIAFTVSGDPSIAHSLTIDNVPIANGLNLITARVLNTAGRTGFASVHVKRYAGEPQLTITSPLPGTQTGATSLAVSGGYANIDPATLAVTAGGLSYPVQIHESSDTTGTFIAPSVPLAAAQTTTITVTARNRASGAPVTGTIDVQNVAGAPAIAITAPADNTYFRSDSSKPTVTGTFTAGLSAIVQVNGTVVTPSGNGFSTTVDFAPGSTGLTPIVARVANVDGTSATAAVRIVRLSAPLAAGTTFPAQNATNVDAGVLLLVLFNNPIEKSAIVPGALRLTDAAGAEITGKFFIDREALSFAPDIPLALGTTYTFTISQALKDVAGGSLASPFTLSFTTASSAPSAAPSITPTDFTGCVTSYTIHGTASVAGARLQLAIDGLTQPATAASDRSFTFTLDLTSGIHIARVREIGADGTLSPETAVTIRVSCGSLQVIGASFDRTAKTVTIQFSRPVTLASLTASPAGTIQITPAGGSAITGTVALNANGDVATVTTTADLSASVVTLFIKRTVQDTTGGTLAGDYTQLFSASGDAPIEPGKGYVSGGVFDATTGRPLANATVTIQAPVTAFSVPSRLKSMSRLQPVVADTGTTATSATGRYSRSLAEGAYTIEVSAAGYTTVWRQVVVRAGAGVIPIDIRLTRRGAAQTISTGAATIAAAVDTTVTHAAELTIPAASALASHTVTLSPVGAQSLAGLLPLGWSPLAAAEVAVDGSAVPVGMAGAQITFVLTADEVSAIASSNQTLSLAEYDNDRDEWRVVVAAVPPATNNRLTFALARSGNYALVYPDRGAGLTQPAAVSAGAALPGVVNPCTVCTMTSRGFTLDPATILPNGFTTATLRTDPAPAYPSGTAVQAYVDEQLNLADGRVILDPPFATDLLIYRSLTNDAGVAVFHLAPTTTAAAETLRDGVDHIRIVDYPGRVDRGSLIGAEGGRVAGDGGVAIDIPAGATAQPVHATVTSFGASDLAAVGSIPGFHVAGGFTLSLVDTNGAAVVSLLKPARATFSVDASKFASGNRQVIVAELLTNTPYGAMPRLAAITSIIPTDAQGATVFTTRNVSTAELPLDGLVRDGRYVILTADAPIAFAWGQVHAGDAAAPAVPNARVTAGIGTPLTSSLGVTDLTRAGGVFVIPVAAAPAAQFSLLARTNGTGDGDPLLGTSIPAAGAFVPFGILPLLAPPLAMPVITPADGSVISADAPFTPQAVFATTIDSTSVANAITITNLTTGRAMTGTTTAAGSTVSFHTTDKLDAGTRYVLTVAPTIRAASGRLFGRSAVAHFSTSSLPAGNTTIHPEKIRITIPDANGLSTISGTAGALPSGDQALAVRRGLAFTNAPQATVSGDGSFQFTAGDGVRDIVSTSDAIDLQVIDSVSHAIIAIIPLTPFVTADGTGFLAPVGVTTTFTAAPPLSVTVTVPAGAFDVPTLVQLSAGSAAEYANVPNLAAELHLGPMIHVGFDGIAQKPLQLVIPAPAGTDPAKSYFLGSLEHSSRGPRINLIDTLRLANGSFTTALDPNGAQLRVASLAVRGQSVFASPGAVKKVMGGLYRTASLTAVDLTPSVGWGFISGVQQGSDVFWDSFASLFVPAITISNNAGHALIPILADKPFTIVGVDASTGLQTSTKGYAGFAAGDPLGAVVLDATSDNDTGPIPTFASPARIEIIDVPSAGVSLTSLRNLKVSFDNGSVTVAAGTPVPAANTHIEVFDPARGTFQTVADIATQSVRITAQQGDRLIITVAERDVDPDAPVTISFNKKMFIGTATDDKSVTDFLKSLITVRTDDEEPGQQPTDITAQVTFSADSDAHRITLKFGGSLQLGKRYAITLSKNLADASGSDNSAGLKLGQSKVNGQPTGGLPSDMTLAFTVRKPGGHIATLPLTIGGSVIHDMSLNGNLAFVAAGNGGIQAYDISDPSKLDGSQPPLSATIDCTWDVQQKIYNPCGFAYWAVATDHHGRVITAGMSGTFGSIRTFRVSDFINPEPQPNIDPLPRVVPAGKQIGGSAISWTPGVNSGMPIGSEIVLGDKPEAIPRRIQILLQDDEVKYTRDSLKAKFGGSSTALANGYQKLTLQITPDRPRYQYQTVTVENRTLKLRWSVDVPYNGSKPLTGIIAGPNDELYVMVNRTTYAVVALFGFGVGIYDINAIESNDRPIDPPEVYRTKAPAELVAVSSGQSEDDFDPAAVHGCDQASLAPSGLPCPVRDLSFAPDALLRTATGSSPSSSNVQVIALDQHHGLFDGNLTPPTAAEGSDPNIPDASLQGRVDPAGPGLSLTSSYQNGQGHDSFDQPRLRTLRNLYHQLAGLGDHDVAPVGRHTNIAYYARPPTAGSKETLPAEYALVASNQYGLTVVKLGDAGALDWSSLVDVVWIPAGAVSVRVMPRGDMAVVVDGAGRVLLVDLKRIDESSKVPPLNPCGGAVCADVLFPTAAASLKQQAPPLPAGADWTEVGVDDPRIIWKSEPHLVTGALAPLVAPDTGIVFTGNVDALTGKAQINTIAATDPRVRFMVNTGGQTGDRETGGIVPLGIAPPPAVTLTGPDASLAAFRLDLWLPGAIADALPNNEIRVALESERVLNAPTEQTIAPLPPSHLRQSTIDGKTDSRISNFKLERQIPYDANDADMKSLRYQEGFNHFVSPWVVAIADPRASVEYDWQGASASQKKDAGCNACERPAFLKDKKPADNVFEIYSAGRFIRARAEVCATGTAGCTSPVSIFANTKYAYLGQSGRLQTRVGTVMADTVRPADAAIAGHNPPVVSGAMQETYYAHSGEMATHAVDLDAGGRNGVDVTIGRCYYSRTLGSTALGFGWDATMFRRLRPLPDGNIELRDGLGSVWLFEKDGQRYNAPKGLYLRLVPTASGWDLHDPAWNVARFDSFGRLESFSDRLTSLDRAATGNTIRYFYNGEGQLSQILDPVGRVTTLTYWTDADIATAGSFTSRLKNVKDWRGRNVDYEYDADGLLKTVRLPEATGDPTLGADYTFTGPKRPHLEYTYDANAGSATYNDRIELKTNLRTIKDPVEAFTSGPPRVTFAYDSSKRDHIASETSAIPECATGATCGVVKFTYPSDLTMHVTDLLGQGRLFEVTLKTLNDKRQHLFKVTEEQVPLVAAADADLTTRVHAEVNEPVALSNLETVFHYDEQGEVTQIDHPNGLITKPGYVAQAQSAAAERLETVDETKGAEHRVATYKYATDLRKLNIPEGISAVVPGGLEILRNIATPYIGVDLTTTVVTDEQKVVSEHDAFGRQLKQVITQPSGGGAEQTAEFKYFDTGSDIQRGKIQKITKGSAGESSSGTSQSIGYAVGTGGGETVTATDDIRKTVTTTELDAYDRPTLQRVADASGTVLSEERLGYDAQGRTLVSQRKQTGVGGDDQVRTTMTYDVAGRLTHMAMSKAKVGASTSDVESKIDYNIGDRTTTTYDPFAGSPASFVTTQTDPLGRAEHTQHHGSANVVEQFFGYDRSGQVAYVTDRVRLAELHQHDSRGRETLVLRSDGTRTEQTWDAWDQLINVKALSAPGSSTAPARLAEQHFLYSTYGRPRGASKGFTSDTFVSTRSQFSFGGQTEIVRVGAAPDADADLSSAAVLRTTRLLRDSAGRVISQLTGEGQLPQLPASSTFSGMNVTSFLGDVPHTVEMLEPIAGAKYVTSTIFDGLGRVKEIDEANGSYVSTSDYDEAGNVIKSQPAGYKVPWTRSFDARGLLTEERAPEGTTIARQYDARGILRVYRDEAGKETHYDTDGLGRVTTVTYADNTTEKMVYENQTGALAARKDRKDQWFSYFYDAGGRIAEVRLGGPRDSNPATEPAGTGYLKYSYDLGGRLRSVKSADAATEYDEYDLLGRPGITRQVRYRSHTGLAESPAVSDAHTQKHVWTIFDGERARWRMPAAGMSVPDTETTSPWRTWIVESHDAAGNITHQQIADGATATAGASITRASGRGAGRLSARTRFFGIAGNAVEQSYGYADGLGAGSSSPGPASGLLGRSTISIGSFVLAGSEIERDTARREEVSKDLGLATRQTGFGYDNRGRLTGSGLLGEGSGSVIDTLVHADFRHERTIKTDARDLAELGTLAPQFAIPSWTATKTDLHQYETRTVANEPAARTYTFDAGRRTSDGSWTSEYDAEGRLSAIQKDAERIEFTYGPSGRLVGRQALKKNGNAWENEDRQSILDSDGLPADTTFVWDPIVDRLVGIFEGSQSLGSAPAPDAGLTRQYVHGDQGYDDPVEVTTKRSDGTVVRYLPLVDEAGSGSVQAVVAPSGLLAERVLYADAYGDAPRYLQGPVVDKIEVEPTKAADGSISKVVVRVRLSETVDKTTIASGLRVSAVDDAGTVITSTAGQITADGATVSMAITGSDWTALTSTSGATQIEVAVTNTLRAAVWDGPVMPMPAWLLQNPSRGSTTQFPVIQRESFASLISFAASIQAGESRAETLLQIHDLYLAASSTSVTKLLTGYKAAPFVEPRSGFVYFRNRWYSPGDGNWLTTDPAGTRDSSNLYALCGSSPVECRDPLGLYDPASVGHAIRRGGEWLKTRVSESSLRSPETGIRWIDAGSRASNIVGETAVNSTIDFASGFVGGFFTLGEGTGGSIGNFDSARPFSSSASVAGHAALDAVSIVGYATGIAGATDSALTSVSESLIPSSMFDMTFSEAAADDVMASLAPDITENVLIRQRVMANTTASRSARNKGAFERYASGTSSVELFEALPEPYAGIKSASSFLRDQGVSRAQRVRILQSGEAAETVVRLAGSNEYGIRFFGGVAGEGGSSLFETFPASRGSLAIRQAWSTMIGFRQWQIRPGATIIESRIASQGPYLPGGGIQKYVVKWWENLIQP